MSPYCVAAGSGVVVLGDQVVVDSVLGEETMVVMPPSFGQEPNSSGDEEAMQCKGSDFCLAVYEVS